jgi:hypothetical protein
VNRIKFAQKRKSLAVNSFTPGLASPNKFGRLQMNNLKLNQRPDSDELSQIDSENSRKLKNAPPKKFESSNKFSKVSKRKVS